MSESGYYIVSGLGTPLAQVTICHWWPGRKFDGDNPIPDNILKRAKRRNSRRITYATAQLPNGTVFRATSYCHPDDNPRRQYGIDRALGLMRQSVKKMNEGFDVRRISV